MDNKKKLRLALYNTSGGHQLMMHVGDDDGLLQRKAKDERNLLDYVGAPEAEAPTPAAATPETTPAAAARWLYALSCWPEGVCLRYLQATQGRGGDNVEAWLLVPNGTDIKGADMEKLIDLVADSLSCLAEPDVEEKLRKAFNQTWPETRTPDCPAPDTRKPLAWLRLTKRRLADLFDHLPQPALCQYDTVLLIPDDQCRPMPPATADDITETPYVRWVQVRLPKAQPGVSVDYCPYTGDAFMPAKDTMTLAEGRYRFRWRKAGCADVEQTVDVKDGQTVQTKEVRFERLLREEQFRFVCDGEDSKPQNKKKKKTPDAEHAPAAKDDKDAIHPGPFDVCVDGERLHWEQDRAGKRQWRVKDGCKIAVQLPKDSDYELAGQQSQQKWPLPEPDRAITVKLRRRTKEFTFQVLREDLRGTQPYKDDCMFSLQRDTDPKTAPLFGYRMTPKAQGRYDMEPRGWNRFLSRHARGAVVMVVAGLALAAAAGFWVRGKRMAEPPAQKTDTVEVHDTIHDTIRVEIPIPQKADNAKQKGDGKKATPASNKDQHQ